MSMGYVILGLLCAGPLHGYELKRAHDQRMPQAKPAAFGQVYASLGRLERDGLVESAGHDQAGGPERTPFGITDRGRAALDGWLDEVEAPSPHVTSALLTKVTVALLTAGEQRARDYLTAQRRAHTDRLREYTRLKTEPGVRFADLIAADYAIAHLNADLVWLQTTLARVADLRREVGQ
ncbi:PadR family transcriptional regulator [Rugosimonospora africana]|uniref:PadR family transcriptional regulator n=1 Tax=Rugosimonospora africana TaxID=556532 RepID=A0A8J3QQ60_9ACTN|nr:PadR family transcriptional regulator [Rugosimonospora africana]GIH14461.1 PadR family transcriptional regulator [Rugosimonospora africana]